MAFQVCQRCNRRRFIQLINCTSGPMSLYVFCIPGVCHGPSRIHPIHGCGKLPEMSFAIAHGHFVHLHACAYGGERKKKTAFLCSEAEFMVLEKFCDGTHPHKEWGFDFEKGEFNTAKEAEYPKALCEQYANVLERLALGFNLQRATVDKPEKVRPQQQAKGRSLPQIIPEFAAVRTVTSKELPPVNDKKVLASIWQQGPNFCELKQKGVILICMFSVFSEGWRSLWKLRNSYGILLTN